MLTGSSELNNPTTKCPYSKYKSTLKYNKNNIITQHTSLKK